MDCAGLLALDPGVVPDGIDKAEPRSKGVGKGGGRRVFGGRKVEQQQKGRTVAE